MSQLTPEIISRGRGADPAEAAARRRVAKQMRAVREKLTSSTGLSRVFDYELLRLFAQSRTNAATAMLVLATAVAGTACTWLDPVKVIVWALFMSSAITAQLILCRRFLKLTIEQVSLRTWRFQFVVAEAIQGCCWLVIVNLLLGTHASTATTFVLFVMLLVAAVTSMLAASIPAAVYAGLVPLSLAIFSISEATRDIESLTMSLMVAAGQFYFLLLANRLYSTSVATLEFRAEKDALIAELEQAKANSDEARRRAEESNLAKSRFLATMSHELRTPLNAILGFSEVMKGELFGAHQIPAYREYAEDIHVSGQLLLNIINEILDLSRIEAGRYELKEEAVNFSHVAEDCVHLLQMRAKARAITLKQDLQPGLPRVWADERASRQIVLNLLSNAIKFTPPGGEVTVSLRPTADGGQSLTVSDNGPGIPEEEIPTVLLSFGRGSLAIKTAEQGSGLGLPIVKGLVDLHGGIFELTSKPRQGTQATVIFPPQRVMSALAPVGPDEPEQHKRRSARTVASRKVA
jgi:two-component system cell cycle sensor histidine kinase PleC